MKFSRNDIIAVANSRVNRILRKKLLSGAIVLMAIMFIGVWVALRFNYVVGQILFYSPIIGFVYAVFYIDKKQKAERKKLLHEWEHTKYFKEGE